MSASLPCREEHELELADLDLVAARELRLLDGLAVHVDAVQAAEVLHEEGLIPALDARVCPRDGDVVEEDVGLRVATERRLILIDQERGSRVGAALHE